MKILVPVFALVLCAVCVAKAQTQDVHPAYEVASIKLNNSATGNSSVHGSTGQIIYTNHSIKRLIERAYRVRSFQMYPSDQTL